MAKETKKNKPEGKVVKFEAEIDGKKVACEIGDPDIPQFHVPGFGVMTSEEAVKNEQVMAWLIENDCTIVKKGADGSGAAEEAAKEQAEKEAAEKEAAEKEAANSKKGGK